MENKILVSNNQLQEAINYFIDDIKENLNIDLNTELVPKNKKSEYYQRSSEVFDSYEVNNYQLLLLGAELYAEDYNFLDLVLENSDPDPLLVNQTLEQYVLDQIRQYQLELKKQLEFEKEMGMEL